ncbi:guanine deaminase [Jeotgalibacillus soli]|uniref:Guanine deaminase n=1 Tax=Jeotgalibacillus soli TaxID=889306 RepID=A0A0C2RUE4_9BACL|nr:guanine deaminase [Jeotgalibacillus soli]
MNHENYLRKTIELAINNIKDGGGPFAAMVVDHEGKIIGIGQNSVTKK